MSVCGNCSYVYEKMLEEPELTEDDICRWGCSHEDAAYRAQWAYDQLYSRYQELEQKYNKLVSQSEWTEEDWK